MSKYNIESFYRALCPSGLGNSVSGSVISVSKVPTLTSGMLTIDPNTPSEEIVEYNSVDSVNKTITISKRGINPASLALTTSGVDYANPTFAFAHNPLSLISGDINNIHINQNPDFTASPTVTGDVTFSGDTFFTWGIRIPVVANPAARDVLYPAPTGGELVEVTSLGSATQKYNGVTVAWESFDIGTPTPNGSTTVAGIYEASTVTEQGTATSIGATGALLVPLNGNLVKTSAGAGDENKIPVLNASGKINAFVDGATLSGVQVPITMTGDATGAGTNGAALTLASTGVSAGTYRRANVTVDVKWRITAADELTPVIVASNNTKYSFTNESGAGDISGFKFIAINDVSMLTNGWASFRVAYTFSKLSGPGWVRLTATDNLWNSVLDSGTVGSTITTTTDIGYLSGRRTISFNVITNTSVEGWSLTAASIWYDMTTVQPLAITN